MILYIYIYIIYIYIYIYIYINIYICSEITHAFHLSVLVTKIKAELIRNNLIVSFPINYNSYLLNFLYHAIKPSVILFKNFLPSHISQT